MEINDMQTAPVLESDSPDGRVKVTGGISGPSTLALNVELPGSINPDNLKAILDFIAAILPLILALFTPKP
jgi:hypothetical protein